MNNYLEFVKEGVFRGVYSGAVAGFLYTSLHNATLYIASRSITNKKEKIKNIITVVFRDTAFLAGVGAGVGGFFGYTLYFLTADS